MSSRQTFVGWAVVVAASVLVCFSFSAGQEPRRGENRAKPAAAGTGKGSDPASLLPADPVLYVGFDGEEKHSAAFQKTAAYQSLYATGLVEVAQKMFANFVQQPNNEQMELVNSVTEAARKKGISIAVTVPPAEGPALPWGVAVLHGGASLEPRIAATLRGLAQQGPGVEFATEDQSGRKVTRIRSNQIPIDLAWWTDGGHLVIAAGFGAVNNAITVADGKAGDLADSRLWRTYREGKQSFEPVTMAWLDAAKLRKAVGQIPVPIGGPGRPPVPIDQIVQATGLDALQAVVFRSGFEGAATTTDVRIESAENRGGLLALGYQKPLTLKLLPPLPQKIGTFHVSSFDASALYEAVLGTARNFAKLGPPDAEKELESGLTQAKQAIGLDVKADLLDPLGNVVCAYNDAAQGPLGLGFTVVTSVDDGNKLRTSIDRLLERVGRQLPPGQFNVRRTTKHGQQVVTLEIGGAVFNPSFVVTKDWFVVSVVPQAVETFLLRSGGKLPAWKAEGEIAKALESVPKEFTSLTVSDPRETYRLLAGLAPVALPVLRKFAAENRPGGAAGGAGNSPPFEVAVADLPPAELVAAPLFPNVAFSYVEGNTIVQHSRSSLPGLPFGDNSVGPATAAVAIALLLPAVQQARDAARRTQSKNNLKQLALALHNYHDTYNHLPEGTIQTSAEKPEQRLSWMASILPYVEQGPLYQQLNQNQAWDAGPNKQIAGRPIPAFINPGIGPNAKPGEAAPTQYVGLAGLGEDGPNLPANNPKAGMFAYNRATRFADVTDGLSNTVMTSEATGGSTGPWAQGGKSTIRPLTKKPYINGPDGIGGPYRGGCHMGLGDGSVRFVSENVDPKVMEALATISGGEVIGGF